MSGYLAVSWAAFSVAVAGASAVLTGLLVVAVSINIEVILAVDALRSSQWIGDGGPPVAPKRQVAGARGVSLHETRGPAIEDRFFLGN